MHVEAPTVSICITTFQHASFIAQCIESVLTQELEGTVEVLVGDDGSLDATRDIVARFARGDARVKAFFHRERLGPAGNLRYLVSQANGRFIAHLDGDDYWIGGKLKAQLALLESDAGVIGAVSNAAVIDEHGSFLGRFGEGVPLRLSVHDLLLRGNVLNHSSLIYRATARDVVLGLTGDFIDYRIYFRLLRLGSLAYLDEALVAYRWRTAGSMIGTMHELVRQGYWDALVEASRMEPDEKALRRTLGRFWGKILVESLLRGDWRGMRTWAHRLRSDAILRLGGYGLLVASVLAFPRAVASQWRRRLSNDPVFFK